jgi:hypothetical protein
MLGKQAPEKMRPIPKANQLIRQQTLKSGHAMINNLLAGSYRLPNVSGPGSQSRFCGLNRGVSR